MFPFGVLGVCLVGIVTAFPATAQPGSGSARTLYEKEPDTESRWISFENPTGEKGQGGKENQGAKGHAFDSLKPGETKVLMDVAGCGVIRRMWFTLNDRKPPMLRALRLEMFWDNAETPAVSVPFGDFLGAILGRPTAFESALFANPEGRSFNCYIEMPFRTHAKVIVANDSDKALEKLFYDIDYTLTDSLSDNAMYFHAYWHRERWTTLEKDFEILPRVKGEGRFLGAHIGVILHPDNVGWWGEGEVKMYLDGDTDYPTIVGTGTEDYIGTGWGQGAFYQRYQGCLVADAKSGQYGFYRYHIPEPVYFHNDIRVTMQQMGGSSKKDILALLSKGVPVKSVSVDGEYFLPLLDPAPGVDLRDPKFSDQAWVNVYRQDDWSAVAFFYLDTPENSLPTIQPVNIRTQGLDDKRPSRD